MQHPDSIGPLGKKTPPANHYCPGLLHPISRAEQRAALGMTQTPPFKGQDLWHLHELSWLDPLGKPTVAVGKLMIPCETLHFVESKSLKLYLNSLNNTPFKSLKEAQKQIKKDLDQTLGEAVKLTLKPTSMVTWNPKTPSLFLTQKGIKPTLIDPLSTTIHDYQPRPDLLLHSQSKSVVTEHLYSNLMRSNCPVTQQPDWAQIHILYTGHPIDPEALLKYIVSYRCHNAFHEHCVETIFMDILNQLNPQKLSVWAQYTPRGGIAIIPWRYR